MKELLLVFWTFFKIGLFTIGGGYAMIPMIESEVMNRGWISEAELANFLAISESTPGPFAINVATFIGFRQFGVVGSLVATLGMVLPSFIIIIIIFKIYEKVIGSKTVKAVLNGIKAVVIGLILAVVANLAVNELFVFDGDTFVSVRWASVVISVILVALMLIFKKKMHPILLILISAVLGIIAYGVVPLIFS
ncbi:MAG: chromate transporter [Bacilli bacterium]|nr:chromate transporter [Bacilli bacterium]